jgi:glutamyl-tRNA synthetase
VAMTAAGRAKFQLLADHERFLVEMAQPRTPEDPAARDHLGEAGRKVLADLQPKLAALPDWSAPAISATLKETVKAMGAKPPQVMMPFRVALTGQVNTPAIDAIAAALRREVAIRRLERAASS